MIRKACAFQGLAPVGVALTLLLFPGVTQGKDIGANAPPCPQCQCQCACPTPSCTAAFADTSISYAEGNLSDPMVSTIKSAFGPTISFSLTYSSYNADGSRAQIDSGLGYGWTHSYNIFLFSQLGNMFRMDARGRVTKYQYLSDGIFISAPGYFETLTNNMNGTWTIRQKDGTRFLFALVPNTPFLVFGPVYRLQSITDRNNNVTAVSYDPQ